MSRVFLVGHTGSINRGCEAIVRSTIKLLRLHNINEIFLCSTDYKSDVESGLDNICNLIGTIDVKTGSVEGILGGIERRVFHRYTYTESCRNKNIIAMFRPGDIVFVIGGDTFCYDDPPHNVYVLNKEAQKRGARTILWACSIEESKIDSQMRADFENYDYIVPRESLSMGVLMSLKLKHPKLIQCCDPAFELEIKEPTEYKLTPDSYIGINVSPVIKRSNICFDAVIGFIECLLKNTSEQILLIPHVYENGKLDSKIIDEIKARINVNERVKSIDENLGCEELKYYIQKCNSFIGCRTHSTIAAYSSNVPTLVLGYSVKSRGIAQDLFGKDEGYVLMYDRITSGEELYSLFVNNIYSKRSDIKKYLEDYIPSYKKRVNEAIETVLGDNNEISE